MRDCLKSGLCYGLLIASAGLLAAKCNAQAVDDWTLTDSHYDASCDAMTDILLFGESTDHEFASGTEYPYGYVNSTAQVHSFIDAKNVSYLDLTFSASAAHTDLVRSVSAAMYRDHRGETDLEGAEAVATSAGESQARFHVTANKEGIARSTIKFNPPLGVERFAGLWPQVIQGFEMAAISGNGVVVWTFDGLSWTRTGWMMQYNPQTGENERTPMPDKAIVGWRSISDEETVFTQRVAQGEQFDCFATVNKHGAHWILGIVSYLTGSQQRCFDRMDVSVALAKEIEDLP